MNAVCASLRFTIYFDGMNGILYNSKVIIHKFMKISRRFLSSARQTLKKDVTVYDKDRVHLSLKAGTGGEGIVR